jgi:hypothetical protein
LKSSFDSFFGDVGAVAGQLGLGYAAQAASKAAAYTIGGVIYFVAAPLYHQAGRATERLAGKAVATGAAAVGEDTAAQGAEDPRAEKTAVEDSESA